MLYKLMNWLFGYDYVAWHNVADQGVARVLIDGRGIVFYWRYRSTRVADRITDPSAVLWLTCPPEKYFPRFDADFGEMRKKVIAMERTMLEHLITVEPVDKPGDGYQWIASLSPWIDCEQPHVSGATPSAAVLGLTRMLPYFNAGVISTEAEFMAKEDGAILWRTRDARKVAWAMVDGGERKTTSTTFIELIPGAPPG